VREREEGVCSMHLFSFLPFLFSLVFFFSFSFFFPFFFFFFSLFTLQRESGGVRPELLVTHDSCVLRSPAGLKPDKGIPLLGCFTCRSRE